MNIKSLLLGSAAALAAVSGARAADAVMAEPEAVEYVRVCDAYGAGYFYIPGTETCLKIGGYVRYDMGFGETNGIDTFDDGNLDGFGDAWDKNARLSLQISTASDTELGTLKTYAEVRFNYFNSDATRTLRDLNADGDFLDPGENVINEPAFGNSTPSLNFAWIQLGGLRIGKDESAFTTFAGYAGSVINDGQIGYGPFDTTLISYTYDGGNGFSAILSLEDDNGQGSGYIPDVVGGVKYSGGAWAVTGVAAYDESASEWAGKIRVDASAGAFSAFIMGGYGSGPSTFKPWGGDWALWGGASFKASEKISLNAELDYDQLKQFGAAANVVYTVVPDFKITTEVNYQNAKLAGKSIFGGVIRFQRSF
jgi:opacity protein-like surface antigen